MVLLSDDIYNFDLDLALQSIPDQRRIYALRYKQELDRRLSIKAYLLLCEGLQKQYDIEEKPIFVYGTNGKPTLAKHSHIHFNLSHCNEAVICVIDTQPIGVDIESIRAIDNELLEYTMNSQEREQIKHSTDPEIEFTRLWTMKEAFLKWSGKGISNNLQNILADCNCEFTTVINPKGGYVYSICK